MPEQKRIVTEWADTEQRRIERLEKLVAGDLEEIHKSAGEILELLDFPFETTCEAFLGEKESIFVHLDLPEIEDVIPTHQETALKAGRIKRTQIDKMERNRDCFQLVVGQAVSIAATFFSAIPTLKEVHLAAYTQRPRKKESDPIDAYVFGITFPRASLSVFDPARTELRDFVLTLSPLLSLTENWELEMIEPPCWVADAR